MRTTEAELRERLVALSSAAHRFEALCFAEQVCDTDDLREAAYRLRFVLNHGRLPKDLT